MLFIPPTCLSFNAVTLVRGFRMNTFKAFHHGFCFFVNSRSTYNAYANVQFPSVRVLFLAKSFWNKLVKNSHATVQYAVSKLFFPIYIVDLQKANLFMLKLKSKYDLLQRVFCQRSLSGVSKKPITFETVSKQVSTILFHAARNYVPKPVRTVIFAHFNFLEYSRLICSRHLDYHQNYQTNTV